MAVCERCGCEVRDGRRICAVCVVEAVRRRKAAKAMMIARLEGR